MPGTGSVLAPRVLADFRAHIGDFACARIAVTVAVRRTRAVRERLASGPVPEKNNTANGDESFQNHCRRRAGCPCKDSIHPPQVNFSIRQQSWRPFEHAAILVVGKVVCDRKWGESIGAGEWSIRVGDTVHVIGHFISGTREAQSQINYAVTHELATQMQRDPAAYVECFDVNQDGKVDALEHDRARDLLVQEKTRAKVINQGGVHRIGPSPDGRPFVVIGADHDRFVIHYRRLALFHLLAFIGALGASAFFGCTPTFSDQRRRCRPRRRGPGSCTQSVQRKRIFATRIEPASSSVTALARISGRSSMSIP